LFLDMMRSCGVCFRLRSSPGDDEDEDVYVAPEALPERHKVEIEIESSWGHGEPDARVSYRHAFLHDGLLRAVIAEIGGLAGVHAVYWREGVCFYDSATHARALIEQRLEKVWQGEIVAGARGERADDLLSRVCETIERAQQRLGLKGEPVGETRAAPRGPKDEAPLSPGPDPEAAPRFYVSYAWADDSDPERNKEVDDLCEAGEKKVQPIFRDKDQIKLGDRISEFMAALARGDRVFIVLSEKYFRSEACITELVKTWLRCGEDEAEFRRRTRIFARKDAKFRKPDEQQAILDHWAAEADRRRAAAVGPRYTRLGSKGFENLRMVEKIALHLADVLETVADELLTKDFDAFLRWGFDEPET
jgi:internalin A